jgi:hypothetical protein
LVCRQIAAADRKVAALNEAAVRGELSVAVLLIEWYSGRAVVSPSGSRPIAFVDGVEIAPIFDVLASLPNTDAAEILKDRIPRHLVVPFISALLRHGVLATGSATKVATFNRRHSLAGLTFTIPAGDASSPAGNDVGW